MNHRCGIRRGRTSRRGGAALLAVVTVVLVGCTGGGDTDPRVLEAGQVDIKLPPGFKVVGSKVVAPRERAAQVTATSAPSGAAAPSAGTDGVTPTTAKSAVPLADDSDPTADLLVSFGKFRDCLQDEGVKFIGAPDPSNPESPTNDPAYLESLSTCAARSNIVQALQSAQAAEETLTPAQIKERNKSYLKWRDCMVNRGWDIPKPTPDSKGRLFSFGNASGGGPQIEPPPGKDLFTSKDIEQCAARVQRATQGQA